MVCKYYCFVDIKHRIIKRLSPVPKRKIDDTDDIQLVDIDNTLAIDLINGKESYSNVKIVRRKNKLEVILIPKLIDEFKCVLTRLESLALQEITDDDKDGMFNVKLILLKKSKKLKIEFDDLSFLGLLSEPLLFYITSKNDPSKLLDIIKINNENNEINFNFNFSNISIFTKKIFDSYHMETINE